LFWTSAGRKNAIIMLMPSSFVSPAFPTLLD